MMKDEQGFTLIEIIIAILVLSVGLLGLASTAVSVTSMIGQGQRSTEAATRAQQRFEILRAMDCDDMVNGSATEGENNAYTLAWTVADAGNDGKTIMVTVNYPTGTSTRTDTFYSAVYCN